MKKIEVLSKEKIYTVLVDDEDYPLLSRHKWYILFVSTNNRPYAFTRLYNEDKKNGKPLLMHSMIMGNVNQHDHEDGNSLNNQKYNLRPATHQQNGWNKGKNRATSKGGLPTSNYKGVLKYKSTLGETLYMVQIKLTARDVKPAKYFWKRGFKNEVDAARAYNEEIIKLRGAYAWLNPIPTTA